VTGASATLNVDWRARHPVFTNARRPPPRGIL